MIANPALNQEIVEFKTRQAQQLSGLVVGQRPGSVAFYGQSLQRLAT
jgi:hypothetical protein